MSNMKYLMLFEAFESNTLSKMMNFLSKKVDGAFQRQKEGRKQERLIFSQETPRTSGGLFPS